MEFGNISSIDPDDPDFHERLFMDYDQGVIYWEFWDMDVELEVDASTGEILWYLGPSGINRPTDHNMTEEEVEDLARLIVNQFSSLPEDASEPEIVYCYSHTTITTNTTTNTTMTTRDWHWRVYFERLKDGIPTTDGIGLRLESDGTLSSYSRDWFLDLRNFNTKFTVTEYKAISAAWEYVGSETNVTGCKKRIVQPWRSDGALIFGQGPKCVWEVSLEGSDASVSLVAVNGRDASKIEGVSYHR
jgi:hypothetical protein